MHFNKVMTTLNEYEEVVETAKKLYEDAEKKLQVDYGNTGRLYVEKRDMAKALFNETVAEAKKKARETVKEEIGKAKEELKSFVLKPVPNDFIATLEAIKATGKNLTPSEMEAHLDKYKNNYTAYRSLSNVILELTGRKNFVVTYDAILNDIKEHEEYLERIFNDSANSYVRALFGSELHSPLVKLDAALERFMKDDVTKYNIGE